ncbi:MAG: ComEC/Rec2 family competence protein [Christensenellales bacterium]
MMLCGFFYGKKTEMRNLQFKARKNLSSIIKFSSIGFAVAFLVGMLISYLPIINILLVKDYNEEVIITGIACDYIDDEETYKKFILSDCQIAENGQIKDFEYKIMVYTNAQNIVNLGDRVTFNGTLSKFQVSSNYGFNSIINGIAYSTFVNSSDMTISSGNISVKDFIHNGVYDLLNDNLNSDNANICYAILFGQKECLDSGISQMFSYAGISHILAVSGLHISVLVAVIWFFLKKIKCNKYLRLGIFASILLFYAYLCSFSPSVCRASLMAFILAFCKTFMWEYDALSSLSLSGIIILLIKPLMLFSLSFQLSFMCIFAIITFAPSIEFALTKIKCPKILAGNLAISIAINVAILPIGINSFGVISLLGILSNIIVLPIFSVVYVLLFAVVLIGVLIKPLGILLAIPNLFLHLIKVVANYVSALPFGVFKIFNISYWLLVLIVLATLILHYLMTKHWIKTVGLIILTGIITLIFALNTIPTKYEKDNVIACTQYNSNVVISVSDNVVSLVGSDITYNKLIFMMKEIRLKKINNIYAYDLQLNNLSELIKICEEFNVDKVYIPESYDYAELRDKFNKTDLILSEQNIGSINLSLINYKGDNIAISIKCGDKIILIPNINNNKTETTYLINNYINTVDYILLKENDLWDEVEFFGIMHILNDKTIIIEG